MYTNYLDDMKRLAGLVTEDTVEESSGIENLTPEQVIQLGKEAIADAQSFTMNARSNGDREGTMFGNRMATKLTMLLNALTAKSDPTL